MPEKDNYITRTLVTPLYAFLKQGLSPHKLALTLSLGIIIGIMPFLGINTLLLLVLSFTFRLNLVALQIINYGVYIFQLLLYIPFLKTASFLFNVQGINLSYHEIVSQLKNNFWRIFITYLELNIKAIIIWFLVGIPVGFIIYYYSLKLFKRKAIEVI